MIPRSLLLVLFLFLLPVPAAAQSVVGSWALRFEGAIIFRFDIERTDGSWRGVWSRPTSFASDGNRFANITMPSIRIESRAGRDIGGWAELTFPDDRPGAVPDIFRFHLLGPDRAEMIYADTGLEPFILERVAPDALLGPFEPGKVYRRPGFVAPPPVLRPSPQPTPQAQPPQQRPTPRIEPEELEEPEVQGPPAMIGR